MATPINGIYVLQNVVPADIAAAPAAVKVVDLYASAGQLFTPAQVGQMKSGSGLLLGYFDIGEAENYRPYFGSLSPSIIGPPDPQWPTNFEVAYWTDAWKAIATGYIDQMLSLGFGGAFFDVVGECETPWAQANAPGGDAQGAMLGLIQYLADYAHAKDPNFKIWVNSSGAEDLLSNPAFVAMIDGAYEEGLFFQDNGLPQAQLDVSFNLNLLLNLVKAGKPVVTVEYVTGPDAVAAVQNQAAGAGIGYYVAHPDLLLSGVDTEGFNPLCFLQGTAIATPDGPVPVERLAVGDLVCTHFSGLAKVRWVGKGRVLATPGRRTPATPVIVCKGALADNVPNSDLRLTKGHALYIDGALIPVQYLVNHRSIIWDDRARELTIYHVALDTHDVLLANGAPAESYRDDGNRWLFENAAEAGDERLESCAPILTGGPKVDKLWRRLLDRAGARPGMPITDDPDLHLMVDGMRLDAEWRTDDLYAFRLGRARPVLQIVSRSGAPDELGIARDSRPLGIAIREIVLRQGAWIHRIKASDASLAHGFHEFEPANSLRWTDGDAVLPLPLVLEPEQFCELELHVGCTSRYPLFTEEAARSADDVRIKTLGIIDDH